MSYSSADVTYTSVRKRWRLRENRACLLLSVKHTVERIFAFTYTDTGYVHGEVQWVAYGMMKTTFR